MQKWVLSAILAFLSMMPADAVEIAPGDSTNGWGYGYASLLKDLAEWRLNPNVKIDSIGATVEGRALWMVSISNAADSLAQTSAGALRKRRIFIHARTHPAEVQANFIANETIHFLLQATPEAVRLRSDFIFNIIPMYNPDGVEAGHGRLNAHLVDLESNWDKPVIEPEVLALRGLFDRLMQGPIPVEVALNLHSDQLNCTRFFFYHLAAGTSEAYTGMEQNFIGKVQGYFPAGIQDWNFVSSWGNGTQARYPEGYWWLNYHENVLALTYEDTNCPNASGFDSTGRALAQGAADYIRGKILVAIRSHVPDVFGLVREQEGVRMHALPWSGWKTWVLTDIQGHHRASGMLSPSENFLAWNQLSKSGGQVLSVSSSGTLLGRLILPMRQF